jgi:glutamate-ammonia-ligase adenylyltransferase
LTDWIELGSSAAPLPLPAPLGHAAAQAYRRLRSIQHKARLNEEPTQVPLALAEQERQAGLAVWREVFAD